MPQQAVVRGLHEYEVGAFAGRHGKSLPFLFSFFLLGSSPRNPNHVFIFSAPSLYPFHQRDCSGLNPPPSATTFPCTKMIHLPTPFLPPPQNRNPHPNPPFPTNGTTRTISPGFTRAPAPTGPSSPRATASRIPNGAPWRPGTRRRQSLSITTTTSRRRSGFCTGRVFCKRLLFGGGEDGIGGE